MFCMEILLRCITKYHHLCHFLPPLLYDGIPLRRGLLWFASSGRVHIKKGASMRPGPWMRAIFRNLHPTGQDKSPPDLIRPYVNVSCLYHPLDNTQLLLLLEFLRKRRGFSPNSFHSDQIISHELVD